MNYELKGRGLQARRVYHMFLASTNAEQLNNSIQAWWATIVFLVAFTLNVIQLFKWRHVRTMTSPTIKLMSFSRAALSLVFFCFYVAQLIGSISFVERAVFFSRYLSPIYWPVLLIMPVLSTGKILLSIEKEFKKRVEDVVKSVFSELVKDKDGSIK